MMDRTVMMLPGGVIEFDGAVEREAGSPTASEYEYRCAEYKYKYEMPAVERQGPPSTAVHASADGCGLLIEAVVCCSVSFRAVS
ncbi:hypothetical protein [Novipirellula maiorica]|nr:hypothetical protein [Rhodopirellula maiorica]